MKARLLTAVFAIPIVLVAMFLTSPWPLFALAFLVTFAASAELGRLTTSTSHSMPLLGLATMAFLAAFLLGAFPGWGPADFMLRNAGLLAAGYLGAALMLSDFATRLARQAASLWIAAPLASLVLLKSASAPAASEVWSWNTPILMAVLPLWAGDTAALFVGKAIGRHKLAPSISPNKTVEGALGNLAACVLVAWGLGAWLRMPLSQWLACGVAVGVLGQVGDLLESVLKRKADVKDSGVLFPGHGGVLDRIDSLLFAAPAVASIFMYWPGGH